MATALPRFPQPHNISRRRDMLHSARRPPRGFPPAPRSPPNTPSAPRRQLPTLCLINGLEAPQGPRADAPRHARRLLVTFCTDAHRGEVRDVAGMLPHGGRSANRSWALSSRTPRFGRERHRDAMATSSLELLQTLRAYSNSVCRASGTCAPFSRARISVAMALRAPQHYCTSGGLPTRSDRARRRARLLGKH